MATIMSDPPTASGKFPASADERRGDERHRTVLQVAKLSTAYGDDLCILRDVSAGGLRAVVYRQLRVGEPVRFELRTGRSMIGRVAWTDGQTIGVEFYQRVPILEYLTHQVLQEIGRRVRPPRVRIGEAGLLRVADHEIPIEIVDASQAGMRIRTDQALVEGDGCQIVTDGLGTRGAFVRWRRDGHVGLQLKQPLGFRDFAAWRMHGTASPAEPQ